MGPGQNILTRVGLGQPALVWNSRVFQFFLFGLKNLFGLGQKVPGSASCLILKIWDFKGKFSNAKPKPKMADTTQPKQQKFDPTWVKKNFDPDPSLVIGTQR